VSGRPIKPLYTPNDLDGLDDETELGYPGQYPFTRGVHASMYRGVCGRCGSSPGSVRRDRTNERFKFLLDRGKPGYRPRFDLPR